MELTNEFEVPVSLDAAWEVLTDLERIASCLPGAELKEVEGDEHRGLVKVKVGPVTASYRGAARFVELDKGAHRAVLQADGRENRGQGNASATVTATLAEQGDGTKVSVVTDLNITGKVAEFGRGVLDDVSGTLMQQFASNLEAMVLAPSGDPTGGAVPDPVAKPPAKPRRTSKKSADSEAASDGSPTEEVAVTEPTSPNPELSDAENSGPAKETAEEGEDSPSGAVVRIRPIGGPSDESKDVVVALTPAMLKRIAPYASIAGGIFLLRIVIYALRRRKK